MSESSGSNAVSFPSLITELIAWYNFFDIFNKNKRDRDKTLISFGARNGAKGNSDVHAQAFEVCDFDGVVASVVLDLNGEHAGRFTYSCRGSESPQETHNIEEARVWMKEVLENFGATPLLAPPL